MFLRVVQNVLAAMTIVSLSFSLSLRFNLNARKSVMDIMESSAFDSFGKKVGGKKRFLVQKFQWKSDNSTVN